SWRGSISIAKCWRKQRRPIWPSSRRLRKKRRPRSQQPASKQPQGSPTMATMQQQPEVDTLANLEERIQRAVALVNRLRQEKETAVRELAETRSSLSQSQEENQRLSNELDGMREERRQVRERIERLLGHIDQLGTP